MKKILVSALIVSALILPVAAIFQQTSSTKGPHDPTATILGSETEVCLGDSVEAYLFFTGEGPWDVTIRDNDGDYLNLKDIDTPYTIWLKPVIDNRYYISRMVDRRNRRGDTYGEVEVTVFESTPVSIQLDRTVYIQSEPAVDLLGVPAGGTFSGNGVAGSAFYPFIATAEDSPHTLTYTYTNQFGCPGTDEVVIDVLYGEGEILLLSGDEPVNTICDDGEIYVIKGSNLDSIPGVFELREAGSSEPLPGSITDEDLGDDQATLDPSGLTGSYDIIYMYEYQGFKVILTHHFQVDDLGILGISDLPDEVCKNDGPFLLVPELSENDPGAIYIFSGPGVSGNLADGFYYDPGNPEAPAGENEIVLEYTSSKGCSSGLTIMVTNQVVPDVEFTLAPVCLPVDGGIVNFENLTNGKYAVDSWSWDFGDPSSGDDNFSNLENPGHYYEEAGFRQITLIGTTSEGCEANFSLDTVLAKQPVVDFTWINDCFVQGESVRFLDRTHFSFAPADSFTWIFKTANGGVLGSIGGSTATDTVDFSFPDIGHYQIEYKVLNDVGCEGSTTKELVLKPINSLPAAGYKEDFNSENDNWFSYSDGQYLSWKRDEPEFAGFVPVPGDLAWYTKLPFDNSGYSEHSWIQSTCFDFSSRRFPFIEMDLMKSFTPGVDGAVLQYQDLVSEGWKTLGNVGEGINWYNVEELLNQPGGSSYGWGLDLFSPDAEWVHASHNLGILAGHPHVKFRIILATGSAQEIEPGLFNQGFAFDNIFIGERIRRSLLEYFTNSSTIECREADDVVDLFAANHYGSVVDVQYHMDYPGVDLMNVNNPYPPSIRSFKYGIQGVPSAVFNGGTRSDQRFDFSDPFNEPNDQVLLEAALEIPVFELDLGVSWMENRLEATTLVTCRTDSFSSNLQLYLVVIESSVSAYTGLNQDTIFRNVVLDILPSPAGKLLGNIWHLGRTDIRTYSWNYADYIEDIEDLAVVAFVQDRDNDEVLQVSFEALTPQVGTVTIPRKSRSMAIYPNPAAERVFVNLGSRQVLKGVIQIMDLSGKLVMTLNVQPNTSLYQVDIASLSRGMYMVYWIESREVQGRNKLVINR